jgi:hypothetical protein
VKRFTVSLVGFGYGLGITWVCIQLLEHFDWFRDPHKIVHGCHELGKCPFPWYGWPFLYAFIFGPATLAATINAYAWRRWSFNRWACCTAGAMVLCVALYFAVTIYLERQPDNLWS